MNHRLIVMLALATLGAAIPDAAADEPAPTDPKAPADPLVELIRSRLNDPPEVIGEKTTEVARSLKARLKYDVEIARAQAWEKQLARSLASLRAEAASLRERRNALRARVDAAILDARKRQTANPRRLDEEVIAIVGHYRPRLLDLKNEEDQYTREADAVAAKLDEVSLRKEALERSKAWAIEADARPDPRGLPIAPDLDFPPMTPADNSRETGAAGRPKTADEALKLLKDL